MLSRIAEKLTPTALALVREWGVDACNAHTALQLSRIPKPATLKSEEKLVLGRKCGAS